MIQIPSEENGNHFFVGLSPLEEAGPGVSTKKVSGLSPEFWYHLGDRAGRSRKVKIIFVPVVGQSFNDDQWGPMEVK